MCVELLPTYFLKLIRYYLLKIHEGGNFMASRNTIIIPQATRALDQFKYEVAQELGIQIPADGYWGTMTTRDTGTIGGNMTRKLVALAEQQLAGSKFPPQ